MTTTGATTIGSLGTLQFDNHSSFNTGSLAINGGTLRTLAPAAVFASPAVLGMGGVNIDSDGFNSTFSGVFSGNGGLVKSGSGTISLTGASTYGGATAVNAGILALTTGAAHTAALGNTAITVAAGSTFSPRLGAAPFSTMVNAGATGPGSAGATLTLNPGSALGMVDGSVGTFNLQQENAFSGPAFTIGGASGVAPTLSFDIGNAASGTDLIHVTKTVTVLATGAKITIDALAGDTSLTAGSYDLITSGGGFTGAGGNGFTLADTSLVVDGTTYDFSLAQSTAEDEVLTVSDAPSGPGQSAAYGNSREELLASTPSAVPSGAVLPDTPMVPEPGDAMCLLTALGIAAAWQLRRRRGRHFFRSAPPKPLHDRSILS
jgi:autotransporter-associated beta strand protein